jgi:nitrite reductase (NADH) small subunit
MAVAQQELNWVEVASLEEIPVLGARVLNTAFGDIAVFRNRQDEVFALEDRCPHRGGPLSQGIVHGRTVTCPLHNWCIALDSGSACEPDEGQTGHYPVELRDGRIYLQLPR